MEKIKLRFWVDIALFFALILTVFSGVGTLISSDNELGLLGMAPQVWLGMHISFAGTTFVLAMIHLGMHVDFISFAIKKIFGFKE